MKENEIISAVRNRTPGGAERLLTHYGPLLRYVIAPIVPDPRDREECLSEAVLRAWNKIEQYDPDKGSWTAWLTSVARSVALNKLRSAKTREEPSEVTPDTPSPEPTPEERMLRKERQAELRAALDTLGAGERLIFYRKYYYLQPTAQIAAELGLTERSVEGRLYRIRKKLRKLLGGEEHG